MSPNNAPSASFPLRLHQPESADQKKLSTGYPQIGVEVIHISTVWLQFASQNAPISNTFCDFELT